MANQNEKPAMTVRRGSVDSICLYEVTEDELDLLERGSPDSVYLNVGIALISVGLSFLVSLLTTRIDDIKIYAFFWVVTLVTLIVGIVALVIWKRASKSFKGVFRRIKDRLKEPSAIDSATQKKKA